MNELEVIIGLEVHVQLKTESKIFCSCPTDFGATANRNICPVCCGYPGVLPVFNQGALKLAVRACHALDCAINKNIYFERKNYFYPDLPKNYQISQYQKPLGEKGYIEISPGRRIRVNRIHMEEDAGKLIHKEGYSLVDFNRTGTPLLEIVSEPEIRSPGEAFDYLHSLKLILQYIEVSDCDMEKGFLRCDANISLRKRGTDVLGTKVELKNMNTFKGVKSALAFEAKRQGEVLAGNGTVAQETRLWDEKNLKTEPLRSKEEAHDYRYFPEPDLLDFSVTDEVIEEQKSLVGELPSARRRKFLDHYGLSGNETEQLITDRKLADMFERVFRAYPNAKAVANWLTGPLLEQVNNIPGKLGGVKISPLNFSKIIRYFTEDKINNLAAKKLLSLAISTDKDVDVIIEEEGLAQVSDSEKLQDIIDKVVRDNPKPVGEYLAGKRQAVMFLVGQVMKQTKGRANPKIAQEMLVAAIDTRGE